MPDLTQMPARSGSGCRSRCADGPHCRTKLENAHGIVFRVLVYPWHPWFGMQVAIHEAVDKADGAVYRCTLSGSRSDRGLEVPAWMFDRLCYPDRVHLTEAPFVSAGALEALSAVLGMASKASLSSSNPRFLAHPTSLATRTRESAMPQRTATRSSEGRQGSHPTHRQWDLFGANLPDSVVSAPAWPELPMEARA